MQSLIALFERLVALFRRKKKTTATTAVAGILAVCATFISPWEGREFVAYRDIVGTLTICDGHTGPDVRPGQVATAAECDALLMRDIATHRDRLMACVDDRVQARLPQPVEVALVSWAFNVGTGAACGSTLVRKLNAGDLRGACNELPRWNKAGGKEVRGLTRRRAAERDLCLSGL